MVHRILLTPKNKKKYLQRKNKKKLKPIPDNWVDFVRLTRIRSGNKIVQFEPYTYQKQLVNSIDKHYGTIVTKSRQLGITQCVASLFLFKACKNPAYTALILSKIQDDTRKIAERIREMIVCLDEYIEVETDNKLHLKLVDGGQIYFRNSKPDGARGVDSVSDILFDEASFVEDIDATYTAVMPTTEMVGDEARIVILSTPNGKSGWYYDRLVANNGNKDLIQICEQIQKNEIPATQFWTDNKEWCKFITHWRDHPIYSQKENYLQDIQDKKQLSWSKVQQEYNLNFEENEETVFSPELIRKNVFEILPNDNGYPYYYMGIDTATIGEDYTVCIVIKKVENVYYIVDTYRKRKMSSDYDIYQIGELITKYRPKKIGIEINGSGYLFYEQISKEFTAYDFETIRTSADNKPAMIDRIKLALEREVIKISNNHPLIDEMLTFRKIGKKLEASSGKHDDTVMALAFALQVSPITQKNPAVNMMIFT